MGPGRQQQALYKASPFTPLTDEYFRMWLFPYDLRRPHGRTGDPGGHDGVRGAGAAWYAPSFMQQTFIEHLISARPCAKN